MNQQTCDTTRLSQFLGDDLNSHDELLLTGHLDECQSCRNTLDDLAADRASWSEAKELLCDSVGAATSTWYANSVDSLQIEQVLTQLNPTDDPDSLGRIGGYEVTGVVGSGGMGVVLKAHDRSLDRVVAVKVMAPYLAASGSARKRFAREAKAAAAVLHPNVIAIHGVSNDHSLPYLVMPYVRGNSLQKRIDAEGPLPTADVLRIGSQVAAGLAAAHDQGLVHRDIKPANILLEQGVERVAITDFGLARAVDDASMTRSGVIAGTPQYMSPEQARGEVIDARSDLFSLGSLLYAMCTGHSPFRAETSYGVLHRITHDSPRSVRELNSNIPEWLEQIVMKLLSRSPQDRFDSAQQVDESLEGCLAHVQNPTASPLPDCVRQLTKVRPSPQHSSSGSKKLRQLLYIGFAAFAMILAGVLIVVELDKGTLTIESEADNVPIRIMKGDEVVRTLTVAKGAESIRVAAGKYVVGIKDNTSELEVTGDQVLLKRGEHVSVRISLTEKSAALDQFGLPLIQRLQVEEQSEPVGVNYAIPRPQYVAKLSDGGSVELVGITLNNEPANKGWSPNGQRLRGVGDEWHPDVWLGGNSCDFLFRFDGLKNVPSVRFSLPGRGSHFTYVNAAELPGPWRLRVGGEVIDGPSVRGQFFRQEAGVVQIAFTDEPWGDWLQLSAADGTILNPKAATAEYISTQDAFKVRGVAAVPEESKEYPATEGRATRTVVLPAGPELTVFQTQRHSQMNEVRIRGIDSEGEEVWLTTARIPRESLEDGGFPEERTWRIGKPLPDGRTLSHFEFRLRPYRHLVTFENVVTNGPTEKPSRVKVSVESIGDTKVSRVSESVNRPEPKTTLANAENTFEQDPGTSESHKKTNQRHKFATPEILMQHYANCQMKSDSSGCLDCYSDEVINGFAASYLMTAMIVHGDIFPSSRNGENQTRDPQQKKFRDELEALLKDATIYNPPAIASAALLQAAESYFSDDDSEKHAALTSDQATLIATSPTMLKDPRQFVKDFARLSEQHEDKPSQKPPPSNRKYRIDYEGGSVWSIRVGDNSRMRLKRFGDTWLIHDPWTDAEESDELSR